MRVLILSCSTGEGHNSAAYALLQALEDKCVDYELADGMSFMKKGAAKIVRSSLNNLASKAPRAFGTMYAAGGLLSNDKLHSPVYFANSTYAENLRDYIDENGFDAVFCSHLFPAEALTYLKGRGELKIPFYITATDYTCIPFWEELKPEAFFLPHEDLRAECVKRGIPSEKLILTGIPTKQCFRKTAEKAEARRVLDISQDKPAFLVMTGGIGCGNAPELTSEILKNCPDCTLLVLVGKSAALKNAMQTRFAGDARVRAVGFTKRVNLYMDASDVLLTKAGGLSSTEAAVKGIAIIHVGAIPGCETKNADFFASHGMSRKADTEAQAGVIAAALSKDEAARAAMLSAQKKTVYPKAAEAICDCILRFGGGKA